MNRGDRYSITKFVIRHEWQKGNAVWMETIYTTKSEAKAVRMYCCFTDRDPEDHFELIRIEHHESCLDARNADDYE